MYVFVTEHPHRKGGGGGGGSGKRRPRLDADYIARTAQTPYVSAETYTAVYERYGGVSQKTFDDGYQLTEEWLSRHSANGGDDDEGDMAVFPQWRPTKAAWSRRLKPA